MGIEIVGMGSKKALQNSKRELNVNKALKMAIKQIEEIEDEEKSSAASRIAEIKATSKAVEEIQKLCDKSSRKLQFNVNDDTHQIVITVIDTNTKQVIRVIPSIEIQRLRARISEAVGLMFDKNI